MGKLILFEKIIICAKQSKKQTGQNLICQILLNCQDVDLCYESDSLENKYKQITISHHKSLSCFQISKPNGSVMHDWIDALRKVISLKSESKLFNYNMFLNS